MPLTESQIDRAFLAVLGVRPRMADIQLIQMLNAGDEELADYIWDHWMGEPESPNPYEVLIKVQEAIK